MAKTKVLIVDDDMAASRLLALGLERTGYQVKVENVATHALATTQEFKPDVILLDVCMPGADGGDVAFLIHGNAALRSIPIVFLTSLVSGKEGKNEGVLRGGYEFLPKPASLARVTECIGRYLGQRDEASPAPNGANRDLSVA
jgi:DNA-binding response OmpR family regulator